MAKFTWLLLLFFCLMSTMATNTQLDSISASNVQAWELPEFFQFSRFIPSWLAPLDPQPMAKLANIIQKNDPICYGDLGCFTRFILGPSWQIPTIFSFYPQSPQEIKVEFNFFSCHEKFNPSKISFNQIENETHPAELNFDPKVRTMVLVHGFRDSFSQLDWMGDIKDYLMKEPCRYNFIGVDWRKGSQITNYIQAVANTRVVGATIAKMIEKLNSVFNLTNDHYTIIGHSLGSHISGFAGKRLQKPDKIRNIIGLDPAGPAFSDLSDAERLNPSDARLVLTIHTNGGLSVTDGFGLAQPLGHYSFFPNGGLDQPGCEHVQGITNILLNGVAEGLTDTIACSHRRAFYLVYYNESFYSDFQSMAYKCDSYENFSRGKCDDTQNDDTLPFYGWFNYWQERGPSLDWKAPVSLFIDTNHRLPYTLLHYCIKILTADGFGSTSGVLRLQLRGAKRNDTIGQAELDYNFKPNTSYTYLYKVKKNLGKIWHIEARLTENLLTTKAIKSLKQILKKVSIKIKEIRVEFMSASTAKKRLINSSVLKSKNPEIKYEETVVFEDIDVENTKFGGGRKDRDPTPPGPNPPVLKKQNPVDPTEESNRKNHSNYNSLQSYENSEITPTTSTTTTSTTTFRNLQSEKNLFESSTSLLTITHNNNNFSDSSENSFPETVTVATIRRTSISTSTTGYKSDGTGFQTIDDQSSLRSSYQNNQTNHNDPKNSI